MKTNRFLALIALVGAMCAVSCNKEKNDPEPTPEPVEKSKECKLIKLTATIASGTTLEANLYSSEKVAEFVYLGEQKEPLKAAKLSAEISDKATVDLNAEQSYNVMDEEVSFTVTAEDGESKATWKIVTKLAEVSLACELVDENVPGKFGIKTVSSAGASIAFCGTDKIATINGEVYDFDANLIGNLNREGLAEGATFLNMNNDVNGVVIASVCFDKDGKPTTNNGDINYGYVYAWKDGYDKAPTVVYTNANNEPDNRGNVFAYMNCGGDVNGDFLLCTIFGSRVATQSHHVFEYHSGDFLKATWHQFATDYAGNDGNWGATISPASGSVNGTFFIGDSNDKNMGYHVYTREGVENKEEDVTLYGTTLETVPGIKESGIPEGNHQYGNYSTGNIKAFMYNGTPYVVAATTGWPQVYITIQTNDPADEANHYLLKTQYFAGPQQVPSAAYVYDPATDKGQVLLLGGNLVIARYEISRELI